MGKRRAALAAWVVSFVCVLGAVAGCGDNLGPPGGGGGGGGADAGGGSIGGAVCGDGVVGEGEACDDALGPCCSGCQLSAFDNPCREAAGECDQEEVCDGLVAECPEDAARPDGASCSLGFCANGACTECDPEIDADFDGANQCDDCNDASGLVRPGRDETCNGVDEDCDGGIDEDFDGDEDGYSICSADPMLFDCDDGDMSINPGAPEQCGGAGTGNGADDNCNGYIDETCQPCDPNDDDGDGRSECEGDCDDASSAVSPDREEACDGVDTDCNRFTVRNCGVSDPCAFEGDADVCRDDLECGCVVDASGRCTGDFRCASFCEGSFTGPIGAGCAASQSCRYRWTLSDNQHACAETTAPLGSLLAGEVCTSDSQCRSGQCDRMCIGPGCNTRRCIDYCDHDEPGRPGSCAAGTVCEIVGATGTGAFMFASCRLDDNGDRDTGDTCAGGCRFGARSCVGGVCAEPCGHDAHCPASTHCSLGGNRISVGTWGGDAPPGVAGEPAVETVPVCLADSGPGAHDRPAGAVCAQNGDCRSNFCDQGLSICASLCVTDASCPPGLTCEAVYLRTAPDAGITWGRACVATPAPALLQPMP